MHPRVSLSLAPMRLWPVEQGIAFLCELGVGHASWSLSQLDGGGAARVLAEAPPTLSLGTGGLDLLASADAAREALVPLIERARDLASPIAFAVSGPTPERMPGDEALRRLVAHLAPAVEQARTSGVWLAIENNGAATRDLGFIQSLADAALLARATGAGIALELQNCWHECQLAATFRAIVQHIAVVQVSDFKLGEELRFNRRVPGDGSIPLEWLMGALLEAGYDGPFELEILGPAVAAEGPEAAMRRGLEWISERLVRWGA